MVMGVSSFADSHQEQRFQKPIQDLLRSFKKKDIDLVIDQLIESGNRTDLFELEALLRVYESEYSDTLQGFLEDEIKPFEDELGRLLDLKEAILFSEVVQAPKEVIAFLKGREDAQRSVLKRFLVEHQFFGKKASHSPLIELQKSIEETEWASKKSDRKHVLKAFKNLFKEIRNKEYDMTELEDGLHEFRRDVRWIPIYLRSFPDLFRLDSRELPEAKISPGDPMFSSPYSKLARPKNSVSFPILFPKIGLVALNKIVDRLGKAKDVGKMQEILTHAFLEVGVVATKTQAKNLAGRLVKSHPSYIPVTRTAQSIYHAVTKEEDGLNQALLSVLKDQKDWKKHDCKGFLKSLGK